MIHFKDTKNKSALSTRWLQMTKQEQIIEKKKMEIQAKLEAQKQAAALAAQAKLTNPATNEESGSSNIFSNDGSFMSQYKALLEKQVKEAKEKQEQVGIKKNKSEHKEKSDTSLKKEEHDSDEAYHHNERRPERGSRDRHRRWNDRGRHRQHSPTTPIVEDRKKNLDTLNIPPLMQLSVRPPDDHSPPSSHTSRWESHDGPMNDDYDHDDYDPDDQDDNSQDNPNSDSSMGQSSMNFGPMGCGPGLMGPGFMGPGPMGAGPMDPGPMGPMGPGPNMPPGPCPPSSGPMMGPGPMPPMPPPFMNPNFPMPPNFMGPNGLCGPMPPMCGPNMRGPRPNGPMPPFFPPFSNQMPGPNGPPNAMMTTNPGKPWPFRANGPNFCPPPFGPNGPNFGPNGPNPPFMGPNKESDCKSLDIPPPEPMKLQNIPPPMPMPLNHIPKPKDMEPCNIPAPPIPNQVLSPDVASAVRRAAVEITANGDQWEQALKIQDNMWFLRNTNSNEYKAYRELVNQMRREQPEIKPEDKYEPEFSLEDDDSNDSKLIKEEMNESYNIYTNQSNIKREHTSSQSDEDEKRERRRRKKSRWGDTSDVKPGTVATLPNVMPGASLAKIDEEGLKLTNVNRNNHALMQYAMTNYGTTNLSVEDWKKCENNFKLNLLYQDMLKKRQEVERLAAAGKHKYEYDSDEDTSDGTWEHRLRAKEMNATERWATELTKQAEGKHHIGDFLPPEELKKFMEKYSAVKSGKEPDLSDYKEYKLKEDNVGFKMLQKLGWSEGEGLGAEGTGIVEPINKAKQPVANLGLGAASADGVCPDDDEFDAYRKRMMLAYRFRPNPLNNPRRPYY